MNKSVRRFTEPYLPDVQYFGEYPVISNNKQDFKNISFTRYGSGASGPFHCFVDDWRLEAIWRDPLYMVDRAFHAGTVVLPDFSIFPHYPNMLAKYQVWRSRLIGAYWQLQGVTIIPVLQWTSSEDVYIEQYFQGLKQCQVVAVRAPTKGHESDWYKCAELFQQDYKGQILHFGPKRGFEVWRNVEVLPLNPGQKPANRLRNRAAVVEPVNNPQPYAQKQWINHATI